VTYVLADGPSHGLLDAAHQVLLKPLCCVNSEHWELVEFDAVFQEQLGFPAEAVVLFTIMVIQGFLVCMLVTIRSH